MRLLLLSWSRAAQHEQSNEKAHKGATNGGACIDFEVHAGFLIRVARAACLLPS